MMPQMITIVNATTYAQGRASFDLAMEFYENKSSESTLEGELDGCPYCVYWECVYPAGLEVLNIVVKWGDPNPS